VGIEVGASLDEPELVDPDLETPGGGHRRVFHPHAAGGGIAGVGEHRLALLYLPLVEGVEGGIRHVDLAPRLEDRGDVVAEQTQRYRVEGAQIRGDVLTYRAVTAGGAGVEDTIAIGEHDGQPVDLQLTDVSARSPPQLTLHTGLPRRHLLA
jgi:hypothetical protein